MWPSLRLRRVEFGTSSGDILDRVAKGESVHRVRTLRELKRRLHDGRRCVAFFHECLPEDPLVFIHVGLTNSIAPSLQALDTLKNEVSPACAIFYSVNSPHSALGGLDLATLLIKETAALMGCTFPSIHTYSTLSPIPGFRKWLAETGPSSSLSGAVAVMPPHLQVELCQHFNTEDVGVACRELCAFAAAQQPDDRDLAALSLALPSLQGPLMNLCGHYLLSEKTKRGLPLDPVTRFHIRNGAILHSLNWMGNPSAAGLKSSLGMMVNYRYDLPSLVDHAAAFERTKIVPCSDEGIRVSGSSPKELFL